MEKILIVVDMQNDFIDGVLGTKEAEGIVSNVAEKIETFDGTVIFTRDTHGEDYMETQEGKLLPVPHCIKNTKGWEISDRLKGYCTEEPVDKPSFGSIELGEKLKKLHESTGIESITIIGLCTDICVISNAMILKAFLPEVKISVDAKCCAGVTPESHQTALEAMKACHIFVD